MCIRDRLYQSADIVHAVIGSGIQFVNIQRTPGIESLTGFAFVTRLCIGLQIQAIDRFRKNTGTSRLTDPSGTGKQIGLSPVSYTHLDVYKRQALN